MVLPLSIGALQVIWTEDPTIAVVTVAGVLGALAERI